MFEDCSALTAGGRELGFVCDQAWNCWLNEENVTVEQAKMAAEGGNGASQRRAQSNVPALEIDERLLHGSREAMMYGHLWWP
jgi:hypothetical protein